MPFKQQNNFGLSFNYALRFKNEEMDCKTIKILKQIIFFICICTNMKHLHILLLTSGKVLSAIYPSGSSFIILSTAMKWTPCCTRQSKLPFSMSSTCWFPLPGNWVPCSSKWSKLSILAQPVLFSLFNLGYNLKSFL